MRVILTECDNDMSELKRCFNSFAVRNALLEHGGPSDNVIILCFLD